MDTDIAEARENERSGATQVGYVYVASTNVLTGSGIYKVGSTNNIERRMKDLSAGTGVPEQFHISWFVRCRSVDEAQRLEKWVQDALTECSALVRDRREFFRVGTPVGVWGCIREGARKLGITIVENILADPRSILDADHKGFLTQELFYGIPSEYRDFYIKGARDILPLMHLIMNNNTQNNRMEGLLWGLYGALSGNTVPDQRNLSLFEIVRNVIGVVYGADAMTSFAEKYDENVLGKYDEDKNDYDFEWRHLIDTHPNWPRESNRHPPEIDDS